MVEARSRDVVSGLEQGGSELDERKPRRLGRHQRRAAGNLGRRAAGPPVPAKKVAYDVSLELFVTRIDPPGATSSGLTWQSAEPGPRLLYERTVSVASHHL